jgi:hypothetical protein
MATNTPAVFYRGNPAYGTTNVSRAVSNKALTSNLATITTSANHGISNVGTLVSIQGVDANLDGLYPVYTLPGLNTFTFVKTTSNISSAAVSPNGSAIFNTLTATATAGTISNQAIVNSNAIITTTSAHSLAIGDIVRVNTGTTGTDGTFVVSTVPTTSIFTFVTSTATLASAAVSQGCFAKFPDVYTLAASTNGIVTNAIFANPTASGATVNLTIDNVSVAEQLSIGANASTFIDFKQFFATTKKISVAASIPQIDVMVSGITIV